MTRGAVRREPFGWPLRCPSCKGLNYYGKLKVPGDAAGNKVHMRCPNCDTRLVAVTDHSGRGPD